MFLLSFFCGMPRLPDSCRPWAAPNCSICSQSEFIMLSKKLDSLTYITPYLVPLMACSAASSLPSSVSLACPNSAIVCPTNLSNSNSARCRKWIGPFFLLHCSAGLPYSHSNSTRLLYNLRILHYQLGKRILIIRIKILNNISTDIER